MLKSIEDISTPIMSSEENNLYTSSNITSNSQSISWTYKEGLGILILIGVLSIIVNTRVLISVIWIKRPLSATLYISLSLAAADLLTSLILLVNLIVNSYLPMVFNIVVPSCFALVFEALRLGGIINTVLHLLFLACNHYLGIVRPLHYSSIMTHRKTTICLLILWFAPPIYMSIYFSSKPNEGFLNSNCTYNFMYEFDFRIMFTSILFIPFIVMTFIYSHILLIVRQQQRNWYFGAERGTSYRHQTRRRPDQIADQKRSFRRNIKALHTTLLILGSFVAGLLPPITVFLLVCKTCYVQQTNDEFLYTLFWIVNVLLVTKPLANPIIYAARMQEIKDATRRMRASLCYGEGKCRFCSPALPFLCLCCGCNTYDSSTSHIGLRGGTHRGQRWPRNTDPASNSIHNHSFSWHITNGNSTAKNQNNTVL